MVRKSPVDAALSLSTGLGLLPHLFDPLFMKRILIV
jgi:hypothetical protein